MNRLNTDIRDLTWDEYLNAVDDELLLETGDVANLLDAAMLRARHRRVAASQRHADYRPRRVRPPAARGGIRPAGETRRGFLLWAGRRAAARLRRIIGVRRRELRVAENCWRRYNSSDSRSH